MKLWGISALLLAVDAETQFSMCEDQFAGDCYTIAAGYSDGVGWNVTTDTTLGGVVLPSASDSDGVALGTEFNLTITTRIYALENITAVCCTDIEPLFEKNYTGQSGGYFEFDELVPLEAGFYAFVASWGTDSDVSLQSCGWGSGAINGTTNPPPDVLAYFALNYDVAFDEACNGMSDTSGPAFGFAFGTAPSASPTASPTAFTPTTALILSAAAPTKIVVAITFEEVLTEDEEGDLEEALCAEAVDLLGALSTGETCELVKDARRRLLSFSYTLTILMTVAPELAATLKTVIEEPANWPAEFTDAVNEKTATATVTISDDDTAFSAATNAQAASALVLAAAACL